MLDPQLLRILDTAPFCDRVVYAQGVILQS